MRACSQATTSSSSSSSCPSASLPNAPSPNLAAVARTPPHHNPRRLPARRRSSVAAPALPFTKLKESGTMAVPQPTAPGKVEGKRTERKERSPSSPPASSPFFLNLNLNLNLFPLFQKSNSSPADPPRPPPTQRPGLRGLQEARRNSHHNLGTRQTQPRPSLRAAAVRCPHSSFSVPLPRRGGRPRRSFLLIRVRHWRRADWQVVVRGGQAGPGAGGQREQRDCD